MKYILTLCTSLLASIASAADPPGNAVVRIRTDVDTAEISLNDRAIGEDSYGNPLAKDSWFILNLPVETYRLKVTSGDYDPVDSTITLVEGEIYTFDIKFTALKYEDTPEYFVELPESAGGVKLVLQSEPDSCSLVIGVNSVVKSTPAALFVRPGEYSISASREGFDRLESTLKIDQGVPIRANFRLKSIRPEQVTPESLGLSYMNQEPIIDPKTAEIVKRRYKSLTESFAIFPLAQGILARIVVGRSQRQAADALIISGIGLTLGSHFLGKLLYKKKQQYIIDENIRREMHNAQVGDNNRQVDQSVNQENSRRNKEWDRENRNRGIVEVENIELAQ